MACKYVAYYRVSTARQGASGLGIEAQKREVARHVAESGCEVIAEYTEVETGKKHDLDNRPELRKAIAHAKRSKATLVVAKLDRLLRSTVVHSLLKTSGVKFIACDNPHANPFTLDILAAVAEEEVRQISARTKAALASKKARGVLLGGARPECRGNLSEAARAKGTRLAAAARTRNAIESYADIADYMAELADDGLSLRAIADDLNAQGQTTRRGKPWNPMQVSRVLARFGAE